MQDGTDDKLPPKIILHVYFWRIVFLCCFCLLVCFWGFYFVLLCFVCLFLVYICCPHYPECLHRVHKILQWFWGVLSPQVIKPVFPQALTLCDSMTQELLSCSPSHGSLEQWEAEYSYEPIWKFVKIQTDHYWQSLNLHKAFFSPSHSL